jgi:hypothetical protein
MLKSFLGLFLMAGAQAQSPPTPPPEKASITDLKLAQTPAVHALCILGKGDNEAFQKATGDLATYLVSQGIAPNPAFSTFWKPGKDPQQPQTDAEWDACFQVESPPKSVPEPFLSKDVPAQDAGHATCESSPEKISECFKALFEFVAANHRDPTAPPRYTVTKANTPDKSSTYEVWLPLVPASAPNVPPKP